jgi:hypothetical protein
MNRDAFPDRIGVAYPVQAASETGARWDLPQSVFDRWWAAVPPEDRDEFLGMHDGDYILARFVCAFEQLTTVQKLPSSGGAIITAYAIAAHLEPNSNDTKIRAAKAWRHDAVQQLLDRLRYRGMRQTSARITSSVGFLIENMVARALDHDNASVLDQAAAVKAALAFTKIVAEEDALERKERGKRGAVRINDKKPGEIETPTADRAVLYLRMLQEQLGPAVFQQALADAKTEDTSA